MKAAVSGAGAVTIPRALRQRLRIRPGDVLDVREQGGRIIVTKTQGRHTVDELYGVLKLGQPTDRLMRSLRGAPDAV
jgi:AbrB family looped-hinge helix DNA binding protein